MPWGEILLGTGLGAVALFVWYAVCWMALGHHNRDFKAVPNRAAVEAALRDAGATEGFYTLPHWHDFEGGMGDPAFAKRYEEGPNALIVGHRPRPAMEGIVFVHGFLLDVVQALGCALLFHFVGGFGANLPATVVFFALAGAFVHFVPHASHSVWMKFPWSHALKSTFDGAVGFALVGVVLHFVMG